jgi:hypothetical protein
MKVGDKGKYWSIREYLNCEIIGIKTDKYSGSNDLKIRISPGQSFRCRKVTSISSLNFIPD